jgi:hypothetical protein
MTIFIHEHLFAGSYPAEMFIFTIPRYNVNGDDQLKLLFLLTPIFFYKKHYIRARACSMSVTNLK